MSLVAGDITSLSQPARGKAGLGSTQDRGCRHASPLGVRRPLPKRKSRRSHTMSTIVHVQRESFRGTTVGLYRVQTSLRQRRSKLSRALQIVWGRTCPFRPTKSAGINLAQRRPLDNGYGCGHGSSDAITGTCDASIANRWLGWLGWAGLAYQSVHPD